MIYSPDEIMPPRSTDGWQREFISNARLELCVREMVDLQRANPDGEVRFGAAEETN